MIREILFRGKRVDNGEWVYGGLLTYNLLKQQRCLIMSFDVKLVNLKIEAEQTSEFIIPETVGQFTGLPDKNGTKIFEGDIAKNDAGILFEVFYSQRLGFTMRRINNKGQFIDGESQWVSVANYCIFIEVIGNIHEGDKDEE